MSTSSVGRRGAMGPVVSLLLGAVAAVLLVWALLMAVSPDSTSGTQTNPDEVVNYGS